MRPTALLVESWRSAKASRAFSVLFALISFAVLLLVVVLAGQARAQQASVDDEFSRPELRTVSIVDAQGLGVIPWQTSNRAGALDLVEEAWVLGAAFEVENGAVPGLGRVSAQAIEAPWDSLPVDLESGRFPASRHEAVVDSGSAAALGIGPHGGWVVDARGAEWAVVGVYTPQHASAPSTVLVGRQQGDDDGDDGSDGDDDGGPAARSVTFTVDRLADADLVATVVAGLTDSGAAGQLTVERSGDAQALQGAVSGTVGRFGVMIVVTVMASSFVIVSFLSILMVHGRKQEFGRRRALGASRSTIVSLVVVQGTITVVTGAAAGALVGALVSWTRFGIVPDPGFVTAILLTTVCGSVIAQLPSAVAAGVRDPVRVLRTP